MKKAELLALLNWISYIIKKWNKFLNTTNKVKANKATNKRWKLNDLTLSAYSRIVHRGRRR